MIGNIISTISCFMCALPFFIIAKYNKDSKEPINFWSGDTTLKSKVKNIKDYNIEMSKLYKKYAISFVINGTSFIICELVGIVLLCLNCSLGIYLMYKNYKKILNKYS